MNVTTGGTATGMPGLPEVWQWQEQLVGFGTRYTGSSGHAAYVDWLAGQLSAVPGFRMRTDRLTFSRWLAREFALTVSVPASAGRSGPVPLTYYYPYSGQTPPGGVTGRLVDLGFYPAGNPVVSGYTEAFWAPARGGIALVRTAPPEFSLDLAQTATGGYVPGQISALAAIEYAAYAAALTNPIFQGLFEPVPLLDAKNAGVRGVVVAWTGLPDEEVVNQYNPFTTSYPAASGLPAPGDPGCPAVWVGDSAGTELAGLAAGGQASATLVLTADITAGAATETVWGWLEGSGDTGENIIINTHTDGPNATEENGGLGLLALARHLAALPSRNRDMYFALVTGHFQLPQFSRTILNLAHPEVGQGAVSTWMLDHPDIYQAAVLGVTAEHLGATMWTDDPETGQYVPAGGSEWGTTYTMPRDVLSLVNAEKDAYLAAVRAVNASGWPDYPGGHRAAGSVPGLLRRGIIAVRGRARHRLAVPLAHLPAAGRGRAAAAAARPGQAGPAPDVRPDPRPRPDHRHARRAPRVRPVGPRAQPGAPPLPSSTERAAIRDGRAAGLKARPAAHALLTPIVQQARTSCRTA